MMKYLYLIIFTALIGTTYAAPFRCQIIRNSDGVMTHEPIRDTAAECAALEGSPEYAHVDWTKETVTAVDMAPELAALAARKSARESAKTTISGLQGKPVLSNQEIQDAIKALLELAQ